MEETKRVHKGFLEFKKAEESGVKIPQMFGEFQYIFSSPKGEISCVELKDYFEKGRDFWEIYCLKGDLFEDVKRFDDFESAKEKCKELLD